MRNVITEYDSIVSTKFENAFHAAGKTHKWKNGLTQDEINTLRRELAKRITAKALKEANR